MILTPLGLTDTGYDWSKTILPRRASGYAGKGDALRNAAPLDMQQPYAAGSMYSTVEDLLKWDQALYTEKLLPAAAKQIMWTPFKDNYAYGWIDRASRRRRRSAAQAHRAQRRHQRLLERDHPPPRSERHRHRPREQLHGERQRRSARDLLALYYGQPFQIPASARSPTWTRPCSTATSESTRWRRHSPSR